MFVGLVPEPTRQVEEEEEAERLCSCRQRVATAVQLPVSVQYGQRVVLRVVWTASSTAAENRHLPRLLLAVHDRTAGLRPVPRLVGGSFRLHGRLRAAVIRQPVCRRTQQLLLDGSCGRTRVDAVDRGTCSPLSGGSDSTADRTATASSRLLLRSRRLRIARSDRMQ